MTNAKRVQPFSRMTCLILFESSMRSWVIFCLGWYSISSSWFKNIPSSNFPSCSRLNLIVSKQIISFISNENQRVDQKDQTKIGWHESRFAPYLAAISGSTNTEEGLRVAVSPNQEASVWPLFNDEDREEMAIFSNATRSHVCMSKITLDMMGFSLVVIYYGFVLSLTIIWCQFSMFIAVFSWMFVPISLAFMKKQLTQNCSPWLSHQKVGHFRFLFVLHCAARYLPLLGFFAGVCIGLFLEK